MNRTFKNKNKQMTSKPHWIGFDLDHTVARYKLDELRILNHSCCLDYLRDHCNYSQEKLKPELPESFLERRGAIVDRQLGHIVFIDEQKIVFEAHHGFKQLTKEEIKSAYNEQPLEDFNGSTTRRFWPANSFFETFLISRFACLTEFSDKNEQNKDASERYDRLTDDLHNSLFYNYAEYTRGNFFKAFRERPQTLLFKRPFLVEWIKDVHANTDCQVFLCTNSMAEFTQLLCSFVLGDNWRELFRLTIVKARKPYFFLHGCDNTSFEISPAYRVTFDDNQVATIHDDPIQKMKLNEIYMSGCAQQLEDLFIEEASERGVKLTRAELDVVYAGDHPISDVRAAQQCCRAWRAVSVCEELAPFEASAGVPVALLCKPEDAHYVELTEKQHTATTYTAAQLNAEPHNFFFTPDNRLTYLGRAVADSDVVVSDIHQLCSSRNGDPLHMFEIGQRNAIIE